MRTARITFILLVALFAVAASAAPMPGALWTTDAGCIGVNINIFSSKDAVYLNGGPDNRRGTLPEGDYYVRVLAPEGALLGSTATASVHVGADGRFASCYQLSAILSHGTDPVEAGYLDTPNQGGEYKVELSKLSDFPNSSTKSDNFKVRADNSPATLDVIKFYDADADGVRDDGEPEIFGWSVAVDDQEFGENHPYHDHLYATRVSMTDDAADTYHAIEMMPVETNWRATTAVHQDATLTLGQNTVIAFGNLCLGAGGGHTLGFWSNKNGQAWFDGGDLAALNALNLKNANGSDFDPASYAKYRTWVLNATATNMAYMLSAQLSAMTLNVREGIVSGSSLVEVSAGSYMTIDALMAAANNALALNSYTVWASADRTEQERLKTALDKANNNLNFVQGGPCGFNFAE
jgi:hypothetical protein